MKSILLVIPYFFGDRGQVERLGKWIAQLANGKEVCEKLLFVASYNTEIGNIGVNFVNSFPKIDAIKLITGPDVDPRQNPWPKAPNHQFIESAKYIENNRKDVDAFYYFEPDNLPLREDWFELISEEYDKCGRPFYGVKASYVERTDQGEAWENGDHMIGTGIYPQNAYSRVKGLAEIERKQPNRPWDALTRDEVNPSCFFTEKIANFHSSRGFRMDAEKLSAVYRLPLDAEVRRRDVHISGKTSVVHGCKDSSLRLLIANNFGMKQDDPLTFAHAGDMGDLIYALPSIKEKGGGIIKLSPDGYARAPMTLERQADIKPLLLSQSYVKDVVPHDEAYVDFDFRPFRVLHKQHSNLVQDQAEWVGSSPTVGEKAWLSTPEPCAVLNQVIINRTERYQNAEFPWVEVLRKWGKRSAFIGLSEEHQKFEMQFGSVPHSMCADLLEVMNLIASSKFFVGNQSACFAIAEGLKHPRLQETCPEAKDCLFKGQMKSLPKEEFPEPMPNHQNGKTLGFDLKTAFLEALKDEKFSHEIRAIFGFYPDPEKRSGKVQYIRRRRKPKRAYATSQ